MGGSGSCEVYLVTAHISLEFDCVLTSYEVGVLVVVVQKVVHLGLMEFSWRSHSSSSYSAPVSARETTSVVA